ncbi:hypothetical protein HPE56_17090 [Maribacter sp. ANRC-HE7]|uniref:Uncharacterized protein n=1 Tax=Maribacter aquimaris TaxID=2737171 RepID=A0ABR7V3X5_9FLAO|nr:hypothetical protein [Maribacter aquimaris]MBD0779519.1 hypothetical protein [Maribacter aquimaris]
MNKNYLYIILFFWCGLLSANATNSPFACTERSRSEGGACKAGDIKHLLESKDTIPTTKKDTTKTLVADKNHLAHLQQMAAMHYGNTQLKPFGKTPPTNTTAREQLALHRPQGDNAR